MKVTYSRYTFDQSGSHFDPELYMKPETDGDRALLENIFGECVPVFYDIEGLMEWRERQAA